MWEFLEGTGAIMTFVGPLFIFAAFMSIGELGITAVVLSFAGIGVLIFLLGLLLFYVGEKLHDKWLKQHYPVAWQHNQQCRKDRKGK